MSSNFGKAFDGFYGLNTSRPSFNSVEIKAGGYNPSFEKPRVQETESAQAIEEELVLDLEISEQSNEREFNHFVLSDWYTVPSPDQAAQSVQVEAVEDALVENKDELSSNNIKNYFTEENSFLGFSQDQSFSTDQTQITQSVTEEKPDQTLENKTEIDLSLTHEELSLLDSFRNTPKINQRFALKF